MTSTCPYCNTSFDPNKKYNYCINCEKQIVCKNCGSFLEPNKSICLVCGEPLGANSSTTHINRYSLQEEQTTTSSSRKIEFTFTDTAIEKALPLFGVQQLPVSRIIQSEVKPTPKEHLVGRSAWC